MRPLILFNLATLVPAAVWLLVSRRFARLAIAVLCTVLVTFVWPLPPVPAIVALVIALSLRRWPTLR